ncbi:MAG: stage V sporulation protein R, partial [Clostridia bacterium]|nr:stage V sporulation protein R [Clostridia bacterium]
TDAGSPRLAVLDANYRDRGELYLRHLYDGRELEVNGLEKVLRCLYFLWGRPVHLETLRGGETAVLSYGV